MSRTPKFTITTKEKDREAFESLVVDRETKKLRTTVKSAINLGHAKEAGSTLSCGTLFGVELIW
jgi:hypothetical protein